MSETVDEFLKDVEREQKFIGEVKREYGMEDELSCMTKVYNEFLEKMTRTRFDVDIFVRLMLMHPEEKAFLQNKIDAENLLAQRRITISVIREYITKLVKAREALKGKKP